MAALQAAVSLVLILIPKATNQGVENLAFKCCGVYQHFDSSGQCVEAQWPIANVQLRNGQGGVSARDEAWMNRWYPPGPPRTRLVQQPGLVFHSILSSVEMHRPGAITIANYFLTDYRLTAPVNRSHFLQDLNKVRNWTNDMVLHGGFLIRRRAAGGFRLAYYCVDAIQGWTAPYVVVYRTVRRAHDTFTKCCKLGEVVVTKRVGSLDCARDPRAWTDPANASVSSLLEPETPFFVVSTTINNVLQMKLIDGHFQTTSVLPGDVRLVEYVRKSTVQFLSYTWMYLCADLKRGANGDVTEVLGYFVFNRRARAAYLISRNLSFVSALILVAALAAVGCKERMRSSAHGWALGCHIVCLLLFNVGQIVYYFTISEQIALGHPLTAYEKKACLGFAIPMYFLLTAANAWMTAISANMFFGFKIRGGARSGGGESRRFLKLSAFAWSVAAALTGVCVVAFFNAPDPRERSGKRVQVWYRPSFAETRTCYSEILHSAYINILQYRSQKIGTTLYYYVPTLTLVAANGAFLWLTGRKVRYLRRGNSLLKRDEREGGGRRGGGGQQDKGSTAEPKSVTVYIKLLLAGGLFEFLAEVLTWGVSSFQPWTNETPKDERVWATLAESLTFQLEDHTYAHRTTGYWVDVFRALVVLWLAVPKPPDVRAAWRRMRGDEEDSPARGAASRPAPRAAAPRTAVLPAPPRRGLQESAL